jgi:UrcA family protein
MIKFALIAAATLTFAATPALAKDGSWAVGNDQVHLLYSNIDMNTAAGRALMLANVERAAGKLCADRKLSVEQHECVRSIVADAAAKSSNKALPLALTERSGTALAAR